MTTPQTHTSSAISHPEETSPSNILILHLQSFEGPLDLLLHLIREQDIDIFDIPIHRIAEEFQQYVDWFQVLDLEKAGDYLAMAAEIMNIKSRMLLPRDEEKEEDPRKDLVDRLVAYQQVQSAAQFLDRQKQLGWDIFKRGIEPGSDVPSLPLKKPVDVEAPDLFGLFQHLLNRRLKLVGTHQVRRGKISVRERMLWLCHQLQQEQKILFTTLLASIQQRAVLITTFLALLELCRLNRIRLTQIEQEDIEIEAIGDLSTLDNTITSSFDDTESTTTPSQAPTEIQVAPLWEDTHEEASGWEEDDVCS